MSSAPAANRSSKLRGQPSAASRKKRDPGPPDEAPYAAGKPMLPKSLPEALTALEQAALFKSQFGEVFIDYYLKLKRSEADRFEKWLADTGTKDAGETTAWEQNEYFDFF